MTYIWRIYEVSICKYSISNTFRLFVNMVFHAVLELDKWLRFSRIGPVGLRSVEAIAYKTMPYQP